MVGLALPRRTGGRLMAWADLLFPLVVAVIMLSVAFLPSPGE